MKRVLFFCFTCLFAMLGIAQSLPNTGYYRVMSAKSSRYLTIVDKYGNIDLTGVQADMRALRTYPLSDKMVISNPASVLYLLPLGDGVYDIQAQGTGAMQIVQHGLNLKIISGYYYAYAERSGVSLYLKEVFDDWSEESQYGPAGMLKTLEYTATDKGMRFQIMPMDADNYFGVLPDISVNGAYYKSFYASFPFQTASSGMAVYSVTKIDKAKGVAVYEEINGAVAGGTPCFIKCATNQPTNNRLDILMSTPSAVSSNVLKGVYFCNTPNEAASVEHRNFVTFNPQTMRVLSSLNGKLAYVKNAPDNLFFIEDGVKYIPANTSYLQVDADAPDVLTLMTKAEYETSNTVTVTAKSCTRVYGDANPTFEWEASAAISGEPQLTCEATSSSPVGTYPITVSQGTVSGATVKGVVGTLTITKAPVSVTARSYTMVETDAIPTFEATYSGWKNGETDAVLTTRPTLTANVPAEKTPGIYDINVSGADARNYSFTYNAGKLTITAAPTITIKAVAKEMVYGDALPELTYTVEGGTLTGKPMLSCVADSKSDIGEYDIVVEQGDITYPRLNLVGAKLSVKKALLTVSAGNYSMKQTDARPAFKATYSGFKNDETETVLTKLPVFSTDAPDDNTPGEYVVTVSGAEAKNYDFDYRTGKLIITDADTITVMVNSTEMVYGDAVPEFTYTVSGGELEGEPAISCEATSQSDAGEYVIKIERGTVNYPNLKWVNGTLTVKKALLTVSAGNYSMKQTDARPAFKATYSGFKNDETEAVLTKQPVFSTNAPDDNTPGEYVVTVSGAEAKNYNFDYKEGKLIISRVDDMTIMVNSAEMVYGDAVPQFTLTVTGGELDGEPLITCEATSLSDAGDYVIKVERGTVKYPNLVLVDGKLVVKKAVLTVTVKDAQRHEGENNPQFELVYNGWKNSDDESVLLSKPVATTTAVADSPVGLYEITVSGGSAKNYEFKYENGHLEVLVSAGIAEIMNASVFNVYSIHGRLVRANASTLQGLPVGIYVVNGHKILVK